MMARLTYHANKSVVRYKIHVVSRETASKNSHYRDYRGAGVIFSLSRETSVIQEAVMVRNKLCCARDSTLALSGRLSGL